MDPLSLTFAIIPIAQLCLQIGTDLVAKCKAYKSADARVTGRLLELTGVWYKARVQVEFIERIWREIEPDLRMVQDCQLRALASKLTCAIQIIETLPREEKSTKGGLVSLKRTAKIKYVLSTEALLREAVDDVRKAHADFDPSWYLMIRLQQPAIDRQLAMSPKGSSTANALDIAQRLRDTHHADVAATQQRVTSLLAATVKLTDKEIIPSSNAVFAYDEASSSPCIIDSLPLRGRSMPVDAQEARENVGKLASILSEMDMDVFGVLQCYKIINPPGTSKDAEAIQLVYRLPTRCSRPRSMRTILSDIPPEQCTLNQRLHFARMLARSLIFLHSAKIFHKNISPESIVTVRETANDTEIPFLVGFRDFRFAEAQTFMVTDERWNMNLYRHPRRQYRPQESYRMQHDMYSLGICLLEIGLWISFVRYDGEEPIPDKRLELDKILEIRNFARRANAVKKTLIQKAETELPSHMGIRYTQIVKSCLTCLDRGNADFDDEDEEEQNEDDGENDGTTIGVRYIDKIINEFDKIAF